MSYSYWDYTSSTSDYWVNIPQSTSSTTSTPHQVCWTRTFEQRPRVLVDAPDGWDKTDVADFVRLVNDETETGWVIEMVIDGHVDIVDPSIETRTMDEFVPLLKWRASAEDRDKIDAFFAAHPVGAS